MTISLFAIRRRHALSRIGVSRSSSCVCLALRTGTAASVTVV